MPQTIYMPPDQSSPGAIFNPAAQQAGQFMWNMLGRAMQNRYLMQQLQEQQRLKELAAQIEFGRDKTLKGMDVESRKETTQMTVDSRKEAAQMSADARIKAAQIAAASRKKGTGTGDKEFAPDMQTWISNDGSSTLTVNARDPQAVSSAMTKGFSPVGPKQRGYFREEGTAGAKYAGEVAQGAAKARSTIVTLNTMDKLLDRFESGRLAGWEKSLQQWANAFGVQVNTTNLSAKESFQAMAEQLALQSRNMGEGMVLAGQMSDRDVQFLRDMNPQLIISKGGNRLIIKVRKAIAKRNSETSRLAKEYRDSKKGVLDQLGFEEFVSQKLSNTSIFGIPNGAVLAGTDKITGLPVYELNGKHYIPEF